MAPTTEFLTREQRNSTRMSQPDQVPTAVQISAQFLVTPFLSFLLLALIRACRGLVEAKAG
jgi:hypothetical protein